MAVCIGEIPLGLGSWCAVGLPCQTETRHPLRLKRLKIRLVQACFLGGLARLLSCGFRFGCCSLGSLVQVRLLSRGIICFLNLGSTRGQPPPGVYALQQQRYPLTSPCGPDEFAPDGPLDDPLHRRDYCRGWSCRSADLPRHKGFRPLRFGHCKNQLFYLLRCVRGLWPKWCLS